MDMKCPKSTKQGTCQQRAQNLLKLSSDRFYLSSSPPHISAQVYQGPELKHGSPAG